MAASTARMVEDDASGERRTRILDAAERCFVRSGFHRTTMQDVAAEAGMSPGNLYRYFAAKDAIVAGLVERDRAQVAEDFSRLTVSDDFLASFAAIGRKHFAEEPRSKAVLCLEIWAEAARNPAFARMSADFDRDVVERMAGLFRGAKERGLLAPAVDPRALAIMISTLANGLFVRRAIAPDFNAEREVGHVLAVIEAAFAGRVALAGASPAAPPEEGASPCVA